MKNINDIMQTNYIYNNKLNYYKIYGYASIFNNKDHDSDIILPGSFYRNIGSKNINQIKLLWQHNNLQPIGYITKLLEDNIGLYFEASLIPDISPEATKALQMLTNNLVSSASIGFIVKKSQINPTTKTRIISDIELLEISLVTLPANSQTFVKIIN